MKKNIEIEIVSDAVCPWCYIGKKRLEKAMDKLSSEYDFSIQWKPFQLHPEMPPEGMPGTELLEKKYGVERAKQMLTSMTETGKTEGISFNFPAIPFTPNTKLYHRLVKYASMFHKQDALVNSLFQAYFEMGEDISDPNTLLSHAERAGLDREEVSKFLNSDSFLKEVEDEEEIYRNAGITGVPSFIINRKYLVVGAQTPDYFESTFSQMEL
jgi:predicted DsbA family dithiol-disulfide isomerase